MSNLLYFGQNISVSEEVVLSFTVDIQTIDVSVQLPLESNLNYDCHIDWGDGEEVSIKDYHDINKTHIYTKVGEYKIEIRGLFEGLNIRTSGISGLLMGEIGGTGFGIKKLNFADTTIIGMEEGFLSKATVLDDVRSLFYRCKNITEIPIGFLENSLLLTNTGNMFYSSNLAEIPVGFLEKNINLRNVSGMFDNCRRLGVIPSGFLDNNVLITSAGYLFAGCNISLIPDGFLDKNIKLSSIYGMFYNCGISVIPDGFLDKNINLRHINQLFYRCNQVIKIPDNFLVIHSKIINVSAMFYYASSLESIPSNFLSGSKLKITDFSYFMEGSIKLSGVVPEYWDKLEYPNVTNSTSAFGTCPLISNIDDIPAEWK